MPYPQGLQGLQAPNQAGLTATHSLCYQDNHCFHPALEIACVNKKANTNSYLSSIIPESWASLIV